MPAFPKVALKPSQRPHAPMARFLDSIISVSLWPVIGTEDHERVVRKATCLQRPEHTPNRIIRLHHEIAEAVRLRLADELFRWDDGCMRRCERKVEKERLVLFLLADPLFCFFRKLRHYGPEIPILDRRTRACLP